jgi:IS5 family transposase
MLRFRHLLEKHNLAPQILATANDMLRSKGLLVKAGTVVDASLISARRSTKNASGERDPEMHQSKKGNQWYFGMKAHIGVDAESGLVHTVRSATGHVDDVVEANSLLHGEENDAFGDAGYQGVAKRPDAKPDVTWHVAVRPGRRKALNLSSPLAAMIDKSQQILASIRAKVGHPFRVIKRQFGFTKVRYRGLKKNAAQVQTLFALSNLWMAGRKLMASAGCVLPKSSARAISQGKCPAMRPPQAPERTANRRVAAQIDLGDDHHGCKCIDQTFLSDLYEWVDKIKVAAWK